MGYAPFVVVVPRTEYNYTDYQEYLFYSTKV